MNNDNTNENNSKHIKGVTFHIGGRFVRVYGDDAKIMHLIFNYQALYEKKRKALRAGFPVEALVKNIRKLTSEGIMVIVDEDFDDKVKKLLSNEGYDQYLNAVDENHALDSSQAAESYSKAINICKTEFIRLPDQTGHPYYPEQPSSSLKTEIDDVSSDRVKVDKSEVLKVLLSLDEVNKFLKSLL